MKEIFIVWTGQGDEQQFSTLAEAEAYMRGEGLVPTGQSASDAETDGGRILWEGHCEFWVEEGRSLDSYPEGFEPRIRILQGTGGEDGN